MLNMMSYQREVSDLIQKLKERSNTREQRSNACKALRNIISSCTHVDEFTDDWQGFFDDAATILAGKLGVESKRVIGEVVGQLVGLLPYEFYWTSDWIRGNFDKTPAKFEDERAILLHILTSGLESFVQHGVFGLIQEERIVENLDFVVNTLIAIDKVTYDQLLEALFNSITMFSVSYPHIFQHKIESVTTTLLSWSIEPITPRLQRRCHDLIRSFHPFWDPSLGYKLTSDYLSEFTSTLKEFSANEDRDVLVKGCAILSAIAILVETVLNVDPNEVAWAVGQAEEVRQIAETAENVLSSCVSREVALLMSSFCQVYEGIIQLLACDGALPVISSCVEQSIRFSQTYSYNQKAAVGFLNFFAKLYERASIPSFLTSQITDALLGETGILSGIITPSMHRYSFAAVKNLISSMVTPISVQQLQETFGHIKIRMLACSTILTNSLSGDCHEEKVASAKMELILFFKALENFSAIKNSLVIIMGMQPSLLQVLCDEFPVDNPEFGRRFPAVHHALLKLVIANCDSHDYFLATSDWLKTHKTSQMGESPTGKHAQLQLQVICRCLHGGISWKHNRELVCTWLTSLISRIDDNLLIRLEKKAEWWSLHKAIINALTEEEVEQSLYEVAGRLGVLGDAYEKYVPHIGHSIIEKLSKMDPERANEVRKSIDSSLFIRCSVSSRSWDYLEQRQPLLRNSNFSNTDFTFMADFLLKGNAPSLSLNPEVDDLWLFDTINIIYAHHNAKGGAKDAAKYIQKWRWALAQMAQHCVENKMKTSLGKATETFNAIGAEFQRLGRVALGMIEDRKSTKKKLLETVKSPKKSNKEDEEDEDYGTKRELTDAEEWWRIRCLLEFMEILDKMMFNAISGAQYSVAPVSQLSRQFFHANMSSCSEWLSRTYPIAMIVAYHSGYYAQVIRFGSSALVDLEKKQLKAEQVALENQTAVPAPAANTLAVIMLMGRAMAELGASQAAKGLQNWTEKLFKIDVGWLTGVVEMASTRYESALKHLIISLNNGALSDTLKVHLRAMIFEVLNRLRLPILLDPVNCPPDLCIWTEADRLSPYPAGFDQDALSKLKQLCTFGKPDHVPTSSTRWDVNDLLFASEAQLMQTLRRTEVLEMKDKLSELGNIVLLTDSGHRTHGRISAVEKILTALAAKMNKKYQEAESVSRELDMTFLAHSKQEIGERLNHIRKLCFWAERLEVNGTNYEQPAILARKTNNYLLADELLRKVDHMAPSSTAAKRFLVCTLEQSKMLWDKADVMQRAAAWSQSFLAIDKAMMVENMRQQQIFFASNGGFANNPNMPAVNGIMNGPGQFPRVAIENCSDQISKAALKLSSWLKDNEEMVANLSPEVFLTSLWGQLDTTTRSFGGDYSKVLLSLAAQVTPTMAKAHLRLGDWFYDSAENAFTTVGKSNFINRYKAFMVSVSDEAFDKLWDFLFTASSIVELNESVSSILDPNAASFFLGNGSKYIETWSQHQQHKISLLTGAISGYFSYISQTAVKDSHSMGTVSATLRILGLLCDHPDILSSTIVHGFSQTSELLWKDILPQLFSRLSHPNPLVRDAIVSLLSKLCISAPHSVVFQVAAGAASFVEDNDDVIENEDADDQEVAKKEKSLMHECCLRLKRVFQQTFPKMIADVDLFINELQQISLLNEEKWLFVLSNLDHEMAKRLDQIRKETERTNGFTHLSADDKTTLLAEKSQLITSTVYRILNDLYDRTCVQKPTTLNEELFVQECGAELKRAFEQSNSSKSPEKAWSPFRQFLSVLQQKNSRRGLETLTLQDICVNLPTITGTTVPLPGQEDSDVNDVIRLHRIGPTAQILPSKTRPKKMTFIGSDGKEQIFLFKGQEDLHLDERIMQTLQICNLMLGRSSKRSWPEYKARHYAVTPLGPRSGLIQWIGGATPVFYLYRRWQQRQAQIQHSLEKKNGAVVAVPDVERPVDMFQKALRAAFLKHKVEPEIIADRSRWPVNILREILKGFAKETPKDIISRELWMKAASSDGWWRVVCRLARSTAVMSMIGAMLGLGDRHLDNLLINMDKGDVIHIDYNVCFDKGKSLRVPETVPFRLTQNLVHALGPTQIEGVFQESCRHVLDNLRTNRKVLLTILDAFVYDPLVDWASTDQLKTSTAVSVAVMLAVYGNDSRVMDAKPIAKKMYAVRKREYEVAWMSNYSGITDCLRGMKEVLLKEINGGTAWDNPASLEQKKVDLKRKLQVVLSQEQVIMRPFRSIMKTLATCDERFAAYLKEYKEFFHQPIMQVFNLVESKAPEDRNMCLEKVELVLKAVTKVYYGLLDIDWKERGERLEQDKPVESTGQTPPPGLEDRIVRNAQQEQNVYAQNAVKRVRARLEGRVDENKTLSVEEQVEWFIRQATSSSRLAQMYEGWTAWV